MEENVFIQRKRIVELLNWFVVTQAYKALVGGGVEGEVTGG